MILSVYSSAKPILRLRGAIGRSSKKKAVQPNPHTDLLMFNVGWLVYIVSALSILDIRGKM